MTVALGPKAPLDFSVFTAAAAAFLLFAVQPGRESERWPCAGAATLPTGL